MAHRIIMGTVPLVTVAAALGSAGPAPAAAPRSVPGVQQFLAGNYEAAAVELAKAAASEKLSEAQRAYALYCLGQVQWALGRQDPAVGSFEEVIRRFARTDWAPCAARRLAELHRSKQAWHEAAAALERFLELMLQNGRASIDSRCVQRGLQGLLGCRRRLAPSLDAAGLARELTGRQEDVWLARLGRYYLNRHGLPPGSNLLRNPGFDSDVRFVKVPAGWGYLGTEPDPNDDVDGNFDGRAPLTFVQPRSGRFCVGKYTEWGKHRGWLFQTVPVRPGRRYACTVYAWTKASAGGPGQVRVGVDPTGRTDPRAESVVWTAYSSPVQEYRRIGFSGESAVQARAEVLTIFLELRQDRVSAANAMLFDDAEVRECPAPENLPAGGQAKPSAASGSAPARDDGGSGAGTVESRRIGGRGRKG